MIDTDGIFICKSFDHCLVNRYVTTVVGLHCVLIPTKTTAKPTTSQLNCVLCSKSHTYTSPTKTTKIIQKGP